MNDEAVLDAYLRLGGEPSLKTLKTCPPDLLLPTCVAQGLEPSYEWFEVRWVVAQPGHVCVGMLGRRASRGGTPFVWEGLAPARAGRYAPIPSGSHTFTEHTRGLVLTRMVLMVYTARSITPPDEITRKVANWLDLATPSTW